MSVLLITISPTSPPSSWLLLFPPHSYYSSTLVQVLHRQAQTCEEAQLRFLLPHSPNPGHGLSTFLWLSSLLQDPLPLPYTYSFSSSYLTPSLSSFLCSVGSVQLKPDDILAEILTNRISVQNVFGWHRCPLKSFQWVNSRIQGFSNSLITKIGVTTCTQNLESLRWVCKAGSAFLALAKL